LIKFHEAYIEELDLKKVEMTTSPFVI